MKDILLFFLLLNVNLYAQLSVNAVGSYVFGTATSRSFGRFADMINENPDVTDKLGNFWFAHGFEVGIEIPNLGTVLPFNFHYRRLTSHTSYSTNSDGKVNFDLTLNQYLIPMIFGGGLGSNSSIFLHVPMGYSASRIVHTVQNTPSFRREYSGGYPVMGIGFSFYTGIQRRLGFYFKMFWMGHMIPIKELKTELFDDSFYDDPDAELDDYYLNYIYKGRNEHVRADFRGLTINLGLVYSLYRD
ncbi:hypothetical protein [Thermaurantimonas aggregans]|nr:hypothetical protein [Thermaurantimonas aggregans]MCX8147885.1 hypothetical protein [Thermaurantimonas aggregans]